MFSHLFDYFLIFENFDQKKKKAKKSIFGQNFIFLDQNAKIFKNKKLFTLLVY